MHKFISGISFLSGLFLTVLLNAQVLTTDPSIPNGSKPVTIYFHSDQETGALKNFTGDLYLHTGVICTDNSQWQYVIGSWGVNTSQPKMEYIGNYTYQFSVIPDIFSYYLVPSSKTITKIALVVRSADATKQTADLFVNVFPEGLNVNFTLPETRSGIVELSQSVAVTANASSSDSIVLFRNGLRVKSVISTQTISHSFAASSYGENEVIVKAYAGIGMATDTFFYFVRPNPSIRELPEGIKDGINYISDTSAILCLFAPSKTYVFALGDFSNWVAKQSNYMKRTPDNLRYWIQLNGLVPGKEYAYQYLVDGTLKIGDPYTDKILDPWNDEWISNSTYPNLKPYPKGLTTGIVSVLQTAQTPFNWSHSNYNPPKKENAVIYEVLLRDFIANHDWKTLTDTLDYFSRLGVTAIEVMPFNEFEGNESWGYNPSYYFAPDKYYGPKNDLKAFVDACHSRGIAVIMDMVLNHSYGQSPLVQLYWNSALNRPSANNRWYNEVSPNSTYSWGYDFNHESRATQDFVDRVTSYWMTEYKVDGYRFDFTKGFTNKTGDGGGYDASRIAILKRMSDKIWQVNPNAYVILEHFADNSEETELANYGMMIWGNCNYNYNEATMGWNETGKSDFSWVSYKKRGWSKPNLVGYMESHDEERLMYKNLTYGNQSGEYNIKQLPVALGRMELAAAFFLTVPGPKMIWQFGELGYDVSIDFNGRVGNKPAKWDYLQSRPHIHGVFSELIKLKTEQPAFSTTDYNTFFTGAVKRLELNHADMDVRIIGNFDVISHTADPNFSKTGSWYDYFSGEEIVVSNVNEAINLLPGEYRILTSKKLETPEIPTKVDDKTLTDNILIYPNPADDYFTVFSESPLNSITLMDIGGRILKVLKPESRVNTVDVSFLNTGVYLVALQKNGGSVVRKIIVEKK